MCQPNNNQNRIKIAHSNTQTHTHTHSKAYFPKPNNNINGIKSTAKKRTKLSSSVLLPQCVISVSFLVGQCPEPFGVFINDLHQLIKTLWLQVHRRYIEWTRSHTMLSFVLCSTLGFIAFYLGRSSKEMPKTWRQLKSEILWQYLGVRGLIEDYYLRKYNRVGECIETNSRSICDVTSLSRDHEEIVLCASYWHRHKSQEL